MEALTVPDNPQTFEVPPMSSFYLDADNADSSVWLQCAKCLETWTVITLHDAVTHWNDHVCKRKGGATHQN